MTTLNKSQQEAVDHKDGPCIVLAGPGAGKTAVLTRRTAKLVDSGVAPERILLLTFTRAAAHEMLERAKTLNSLCEKVDGGTFHSLATRIVNQNNHLFGKTKPFTILDPEDNKTIIKQIADEVRGQSTDDEWPTPATIQRIISFSTNTRLSVSESTYSVSPNYIHLINQLEVIRERYFSYKIDRGLLDYDDCLEYFAALLNDADIGPSLKSKWDYILVDEYQDTNQLQLDIIYNLVSGKTPNLMIVGDPCQPEGTMIERYHKWKDGHRNVREFVPIEEIKIGDNIASASLRQGRSNLTRKVLGISKNPFEGHLVKVTTESGKMSKYTPNHHCMVRNRYDGYCVYVMKKDNAYRIGISKMKANGNNSGLMPIKRMRAENADALWILTLVPTKREALMLETKLSIKYHLPQTMFTIKESTSPNHIQNPIFTQDDLDEIWKDVANENEAAMCLEAYGRNIDYPYFTSESFGPGKASLSVIHQCYACNILPESEVKIRNGEYEKIKIDSEYYKGNVISFTIEQDGVYFADNILTHNCQAIYSFRGSAPETMTGFKNRFPKSKIINLDTNYRSSPEIIDVVNSIDKRLGIGFSRTLTSNQKSSDELPSFIECNSSNSQAVEIADNILKSKNSGKHKLSDNVVIVRAMAYARPIEIEFTKRKIPYKIVGGLRIDEAAHVKDLLSLARVSSNPQHEPAWLRILTRFKGLGVKAASTIADLMGNAASMQDVIDALELSNSKKKYNFAPLINSLKEFDRSDLTPAEKLEATLTNMEPMWSTLKEWKEDWKDRRKDLEAVISIANDHSTVESFLSTITLDYSVDNKKIHEKEPRFEDDMITITTVHGAKGLEWPRVHIPSFISGHIPSTYTLDTKEEMRILYVAVSRAKKDLLVYKPLFTPNGGFAQESEFEAMVRPHCNVIRLKKTDTFGKDRINSSKKIDMRSVMANKLKKSQTA